MKATATTHTVNIKDVVTRSKVQRIDWNTGRLVEIQGYTLEVGQKVLYAEAYGARSWWVCVSEPTTGNYPTQKLVEIGGKHRATTWDVDHHDRSTADVFGIGLYYDNSGERLTAEEIAKHVRASEIQSRWNARREANQKKADEQERAELRKQWAGILTPLEDVKDWRERVKIEKANVINYLKNLFPGVKFTARKTSGGGSYCISWTDGPSVSAVEKVCNIWHDHTFNGYEDYNEYTPSQFNRLFGGVTYSIDTNRKNSPAAMQAARDLFASIYPADMVAILDETAGQGGYKLEGDKMEALNHWHHMSEKDMSFYEYGKRTAYDWREVYPREILRRYLEEQDRTQKPQEPTTPTDPTNGKANATETATSDENAPAEGLELVEIADGVAVVGDSRTTYRNRREIKAHGARWNRDAQQWQATTPEAVEQLRQWFGVAQDEQPEPTTEANDTTTTATEAAQAPEITTTDQQPTESENGAQSAQNEPEEFRTVEFYNREGVTDEQGRRVKTHDQIKQQAARIECNYIAGRDGLRGIARRLERTKGADAPETLAAYERLQSRAAWLRRAELAAHAAAGRKHRAAYLRDTDPTPTPGGKGAEGIQSQTEGTNPIIKASEIDGFSKTENRAADSLEVTNPIKADDLNTPRVLQLSERRDIVTGCTSEQADELERMGGKPTAAGVVFRASKDNRYRLNVWQNEHSRKERAAILGDGWQWIEGINHGTEPGDLITCTDGTRGRVTKSSPKSCCIEFETEGGQRLSVAGYFRKENPRYRGSEKSPISEKQETGDTTHTYDSEHYREVLTADYWGEHAPRMFQFDGDEIEIYAPTDRRPSWLVVADIFSSPKEATLDEVADYLAARYQEDHKPMLQDSEEIKADVFRNGLTEEQAGKLTAKLSQWARMTDENNHTEAE